MNKIILADIFSRDFEINNLDINKIANDKSQSKTLQLLTKSYNQMYNENGIIVGCPGSICEVGDCSTCMAGCQVGDCTTCMAGCQVCDCESCAGSCAMTGNCDSCYTCAQAGNCDVCYTCGQIGDCDSCYTCAQVGNCDACYTCYEIGNCTSCAQTGDCTSCYQTGDCTSCYETGDCLTCYEQNDCVACDSSCQLICQVNQTISRDGRIGPLNYTYDYSNNQYINRLDWNALVDYIKRAGNLAEVSFTQIPSNVTTGSRVEDDRFNEINKALNTFYDTHTTLTDVTLGDKARTSDFIRFKDTANEAKFSPTMRCCQTISHEYCTTRQY